KQRKRVATIKCEEILPGCAIPAPAKSLAEGGAVVTGARGVQTVRPDGERVDDSARIAKAVPRGAVPVSDIGSADAAGVGEITAHVDVVVADRDRVHDGAAADRADASAERMPVCAVEARDVSGIGFTDRGKRTGDEQVGAIAADRPHGY